MKIVGSIQDQEIEKKTRQCDRYIPRFFFNVAKVLSLVFILKSNEASARLYICPSLHYLGNYPVHIMHWPPLMYVLMYRSLRGKLIMPGFRLPDFRHFSALLPSSIYSCSIGHILEHEICHFGCWAV